ncbi:MAG: DNA double-strand break repair nuclease NurA [Thermofilum sp.]|nr:DNA double-strand break repair nuclease NurA [Thermofilum sp.]MCC6066019.1 DNA double-strand break repair nuclease NurA [Thermofilum sp.]
MEDLANVLTVRLPELLEEGSRQARVFTPIARLEDYINDFELYSPDEEEAAEEQGEVEVASEASGLREHPLEPAGEWVPVAAVDSSVALLGESDVGVFAAFRCAVVYNDGRPPQRFTYVAHITEASRAVYAKLREMLSDSPFRAQPPACSLDRLVYRFMNLIERLAQRYACTQVRGGIVLWDGALTRTKETGADVYRASIGLAAKRGNSVVAVSKKTRLRLATGERLTAVLEGREGAFAVDVGDLLPDRIKRDLMGKVYVVKFAEGGFPFRVDVAPKEWDCLSVLRKLLSSVSFVHGYPEPLAQAHMHAYFTRHEIVALQAYVRDRYSLREVETFDVRVHVLGPFGVRP